MSVPPNRRRMTPEQRSYVRDALRQGQSYREIGEAIGFSISAVQKVAVGVGIRRQRSVALPAKAVIRAYELGMTMTQIAEKLNTCASSVLATLRAYGVPSRPQWIVPRVPIEKILLLRDTHKMSWKGIATKLAMSPACVRQRYLRAKRRAAVGG